MLRRFNIVLLFLFLYFQLSALPFSIDDFCVYEREKGGFIATQQNEVIELRNTSDKDWAFYSKNKIKVTAGEVYTFSCEAKIKSQNYVSLQMTSLKNKKILENCFVHTEPFRNTEWEKYEATCIINDEIDSIYLRLFGIGHTDVDVRNILIEKRNDIALDSDYSMNTFLPIYYQDATPKEDRALIAVHDATGNFISWRCYDALNQEKLELYRVRNGISQKLVETTDLNYLDHDGKEGDEYLLERDGVILDKAQVCSCNYLSFKIDDESGVERIAFGDVNGDGKLDYIVKGPKGTIDPYLDYHTASEAPYYLAAYSSNGQLLWKKSLGWNIESGIWYSPYIVRDLDGDGKDEIILKTAETSADYRDENGRVTKGKEYLSVWDGETGQELVKTNWISREYFENYNYASRNQLAVAYLDGYTPFIIEERGTYGIIEVKAYQYVTDTNQKKLNEVFSFSNKLLSKEYKGQGAHQLICVDVDDDGKDEIILGSIVLDHDGTILWNNEKGHPDGVYFGDFNKNYEGNEIVYFYETSQKRGGISMYSARDGQKIWELSESSNHIHGGSLCADIFEEYDGVEIFGKDSVGDHKENGKRWLLNSDGKSIVTNDELSAVVNKFPFSPYIAYWKDSNSKTILYKKNIGYEGTLLFIADIVGDWREEIVTSYKDEIRIYTTTCLSSKRHPWLFFNRDYNSVVRQSANGYFLWPSVDFVVTMVTNK